MSPFELNKDPYGGGITVRINHDFVVLTLEEETRIMERITEILAENDKLRELVIDLHLTADEFSKKYERPFYVDKFLFRRDHINDRMRKLGIEVK